MVARDDALRILREHQAELKARGVRRAAIFGSVSRGDARAASDLDVLIEIDRPARLTVFDLVGIKRAVAALFPGRVDVVHAAALKPGVGRSARRDAIYAF
jgi:predicted nucleotidyltransferase